MVYGHLQSIEKDGCAAGADLVVGQRVHDLTKSLGDSLAVESLIGGVIGARQAIRDAYIFKSASLESAIGV